MLDFEYRMAAILAASAAAYMPDELFTLIFATATLYFRAIFRCF